MSILADYLKEVRRGLKHLPVRDRDEVLDEIRQHLDTEIARLRKENKKLSKDEAALKATNSFGAPDELSVAYGAQGGVVNRKTGEILLDVAVLTSRAAGRGIKGVLKWAGIVLASTIGVLLVILVAGLAFAGDIVDTFQDDIRENVPHPLYNYDGSWELADAHTEVTTDTFQFREGQKEFWFTASIEPDGAASGCARITLIAPDDSVAFDSGTDCGADSRQLVLNTPGTWQVQYSYVAYVGSISVESYYFETADN